MLFGTLMVAGIALSIAFPIGLGAAIFTSEYLKGKTRATSKILIEFLAGIPSVVYGLLGIVYLREWLNSPLERWGGGDSILTAGLLLSLMLLPTMMSVSDDALRCVPKAMRELGYALGLSRLQTILAVVLPAARSGILSATLLSFGRAIGETIAVYLVIGRSDRSLNQLFSLETIFQPGQTITTKLGGSEVAIAYGDTAHWSALMALGVFLWLVALAIGHILRSEPAHATAH